MPDIVKRPGWNRQFKSHDKVNKRFMTGAEAAERDANNRERVATQKARQQANLALTASFETGLAPLVGPSPSLPPPPPPILLLNVESTLNTPSCGSAAATIATATTTTASVHPSSLTPDDEEEEEAIEEAFITPPSTAPAAITQSRAVMAQSRAGRKRAPTMKTLEAEMAPKPGTGQGKGRGRGRGRPGPEARG